MIADDALLLRQGVTAVLATLPQVVLEEVPEVRVLRAQVEDALIGPHRVAGDRHALEHQVEGRQLPHLIAVGQTDTRIELARTETTGHATHTLDGAYHQT